MSYYENRIYLNAKRFIFETLYRSGLCTISRHCYQKSVLVLAYHDILPPGFPEDNVLYGMTVNTQEFEWQLDYIKAHYNPIRLAQLWHWLSGEGSLPARSALITFDDGHTNQKQELVLLSARGLGRSKVRLIVGATIRLHLALAISTEFTSPRDGLSTSILVTVCFACASACVHQFLSMRKYFTGLEGGHARANTNYDDFCCTILERTLAIARGSSSE